MQHAALIFCGCSGSRSSIQHRQDGVAPHWTWSAFCLCTETIPLALWIQKMSYADVTCCPSLQKADDKQAGFPFHTVPRTVKIISNTMLADAFATM
jgi:hypothetical protein